MELMFEIISRQKFTARCEISYIFGKAGGYIGRSNECEWVLPDKSKQISRKHALISCDDENFYIEDISTNGILTVEDKQPLPKNTRVRIEHGTSYYIGEYTIQARLIHKPDTYISSAEAMDATDLIPEDAYLDLDPLVAMDQQEEFEAKRRMGLYSDLLGTTSAQQSALQDDHNEPPLDYMPEVKAIPEDWNAVNGQQGLPYTAFQQSGVPTPEHTPRNPFFPHPATGPHTSGEASVYQNFNGHGEKSGGIFPPHGGNGSGPMPSTASPGGFMPQAPAMPTSQNLFGPPMAPPYIREQGMSASIPGPVPGPATCSMPGPVSGSMPGSMPTRPFDTSSFQAHPVHNEYTILQAAGLADAAPREVEKVPETDAFFKTLGFKETPDDPKERERLLTEAAEMLLASVDGLLQILRNRADSKNDLRLPLTTMTLASNNPLKYSPNALVALEHMLSPHKEGMLPPSQAIVASFSDIHSHHMGILAGARAAVSAVLHKMSPEKVESKLDAEAPRRFNKSGKLWDTYIRMHRAIVNDPDSFADFFLHDFARAYEMQVRTLHPLPGRNKGE